MARWTLPEGTAVKVLAFAGAGCAVLAQAEAFPVEVRYGAAAISAGCTAVLALTRSPSQPKPPVGGSRG